jgi:hypothetical protein
MMSRSRYFYGFFIAFFKEEKYVAIEEVKNIYFRILLYLGAEAGALDWTCARPGPSHVEMGRGAPRFFVSPPELL